jgi:hypothetical protein
MAHKTETLARVVALLEKEYPQSIFKYLLDTKRFMGTRIFPDVQVFSPNNPTVPVCVVEVGYTRPEKLHHYKQQGIPDVRWYGRDSGVLYSEGDVKPITHTIKVKYDFKPNPMDIWHRVTVTDDEWLADCPAASNLFYDLRQEVKRIPKTAEKKHFVNKSVELNPILLSHVRLLEKDESDEALAALISLDEDNYSNNFLCAGLFEDYVEGEVWSNRAAVLPLYRCRACDSHSVATADRLGDALVSWADEVGQYEDFLFQSNKQILNHIRGGMSVDLAETMHRKNASQLAEYLAKECGAQPSVFSDAYIEAKTIRWNKNALRDAA